jgi:hypothetical protein
MSTAAGTSMIRCTCRHEQQDAMYGKGVRVGNNTAKGEVRCTVCGSVQASRYAPLNDRPSKGKKK